MTRFMFKSKIHRAVVTAADVHYEGSITIDANLLEAADILHYEQVHVWNVSRGARLVTYALAGEPGSGTVCVNGAGAHLVHPGDVVIIATFTEMEDAQARSHRPRVVFVDDKNRVRRDVRTRSPADARSSSRSWTTTGAAAPSPGPSPSAPERASRTAQ